MMGHARPPVNKREKTRVGTPFDGSAGPQADRRELGYTGHGRPPATAGRALHPVFTCDVNCVHANVPPPAQAGGGTLLNTHSR
jgi:hypothetical protein